MVVVVAGGFLPGWLGASEPSSLIDSSIQGTGPNWGLSALCGKEGAAVG